MNLLSKIWQAAKHDIKLAISMLVKSTQQPPTPPPSANPKAATPLQTNAVAKEGVFHWPELGNEYNIVGTSHYQKALAQIAGNQTGKMARLRTVAYLVPDPKNPYDDKAVRVDINGITVGHLDRDDARSFRRRLGAKKIGPNPTSCAAQVWGGGTDRHGKQWEYGVKLDIKPLGW